MKQLQHKNEELKSYKDIVANYRTTLDLLSDKGFAQIDRLIENAFQYAEQIDALNTGAKKLLDVGSGVGLPGIPIALLLPDYEVVLVERRHKRSAFLKIVVSQLALSNVTVVHGDVKDFQEFRADVVTAMAVAPLKELYCWTRHLHAPKLTLMSRKGDGLKEEIGDLKASLALSKTLKVLERPLPYHGTLITVLLPGGIECLS